MNHKSYMRRFVCTEGHEVMAEGVEWEDGGYAIDRLLSAGSMGGPNIKFLEKQQPSWEVHYLDERSTEVELEVPR